MNRWSRSSFGDSRQGFRYEKLRFPGRTQLPLLSHQGCNLPRPPQFRECWAAVTVQFFEHLRRVRLVAPSELLDPGVGDTELPRPTAARGSAAVTTRQPLVHKQPDEMRFLVTSPRPGPPPLRPCLVIEIFPRRLKRRHACHPQGSLAELPGVCMFAAWVIAP